MWQFDGHSVNPAWLDLDPVRVLYEFDGPRIFTCKDVDGSLFLAYQCGEERDLMRFLVVPFSSGRERELTEGQINLRDALANPTAWIFDLNFQWQTLRAWQVDVNSLPSNVLPKPGVMLWRHLRPCIRIMQLADISSTSVIHMQLADISSANVIREIVNHPFGVQRIQEWKEVGPAPRPRFLIGA
jgi:hypothetical protein